MNISKFYYDYSIKSENQRFVSTGRSALNQLLTSSAHIGVGLSKLIDAEAEEIMISTAMCDYDKSFLQDILDINESANRILKNIIQLQILLQFRHEYILQIYDVEPAVLVNDNIAGDYPENSTLTSIACKELELAQIIYAEAEKIKSLCEILRNQAGNDHTLSVKDLITANKSVEGIIKDVIKKEMHLQSKLENALGIAKKN